MAADRSQSPAYQALTPAARKVLAVIEGKVADGGGCVCRGTMRGSGTPVCGGTNARAKKAPNTEKPSGPYREVRIVLPPRRHGSKSECTAHVVCVLTWIKPCGGGRSGQRYCPDDAGDRQR